MRPVLDQKISTKGLNLTASEKSEGSTLSRISIIMVTLELGYKKTSCVSGTWRRSLENLIHQRGWGNEIDPHTMRQGGQEENRL